MLDHEHPRARGRKVLLADRPGAARDAIAGLLVALDGVTVAAEVSAREDVSAAVRGTGADVLLIDDRLIGSGFAGSVDGIRIIVLGMTDDPAFAARARRLGAQAWVAKERAGEELPRLLRG
jgi:DNA-binding NarL/FixJ family response regulator